MGADGRLRNTVTPEPYDATAVGCWPAMRAAAERALKAPVDKVPDWRADSDAANGWPAWRAAFSAAFDAYDWDGADRDLAIKTSKAAANTVLGFASDCSSESKHEGLRTEPLGADRQP